MNFNPNIPSNYSNFYPKNNMRTGEVLVSNRGLEHINCILPPDGNKGALFLGDIVCTLKSELLQRHHIKSILSCMTEPISFSSIQHIIATHKVLPIHDTLQFPIERFFKQSRQFIHSCREKGQNVLVHCHAGVSRSAAIVCAYLMSENSWSFERAIEFIRGKRYRAKPNASFVKQLTIYYEKQLVNRGTAKALTVNQNQNIIQKKQTVQPQTTSKTQVIMLEQQIETHDQLEILQDLKQNKKRFNFSPNKQRLLESSLSQDLTNKREISRHPVVYSPDTLIYQNKSLLNFDRAYDKQLQKSQVNMKNNSITNFPQMTDRKNPSFFNQNSHKVKEEQNQSLVKTLPSSNASYFQNNSNNARNAQNAHNINNGHNGYNGAFRTPVKTKPSQVRMLSSSVVSHSPHQYFMMQPAKMLPVTHGQFINKNVHKFSLSANYTSYKQYY